MWGPGDASSGIEICWPWKTKSASFDVRLGAMGFTLVLEPVALTQYDWLNRESKDFSNRHGRAVITDIDNGYLSIKPIPGWKPATCKKRKRDSKRKVSSESEEEQEEEEGLDD